MQAADAYIHETAQWPLVVTHVYRLPNDEEMSGLESFGESVLARQERFAWLFEVRHAAALREVQQARYARWLALRRDVLLRFCVAFCVVHPTLAGRTADRGIFLSAATGFPYASFKTVLGGRLWCVTRLAEHGLEVPGEALSALVPSRPRRRAARPPSEATPALPLRAVHSRLR